MLWINRLAYHLVETFDLALEYRLRKMFGLDTAQGFLITEQLLDTLEEMRSVFLPVVRLAIIIKKGWNIVRKVLLTLSGSDAFNEGLNDLDDECDVLFLSQQ